MAAWLISRKTRTSHIGGEPRRARPQSPNLDIIKQHRKVRSASARLYAAEVPATYRRSHARLSAAGCHGGSPPCRGTPILTGGAAGHEFATCSRGRPKPRR